MCEDYEVWGSSPCTFLKLRVTFSLFGRGVLSGIPANKTDVNPTNTALCLYVFKSMGFCRRLEDKTLNRIMQNKTKLHVLWHLVMWIQILNCILRYYGNDRASSSLSDT
jgi:hypothetical protein